MTTLTEVVARVAAVVGIIQTTVRVLALTAVVGIVTFVTGVGIADRWSGDALVFAGVVAAIAAVAPFSLARFGTALGPVRRLPEVSAAELKEAAGTLAVKLGEGERGFVEAKGLGRVTSLGGRCGPCAPTSRSSTRAASRPLRPCSRPCAPPGSSGSASARWSPPSSWPPACSC